MRKKILIISIISTFISSLAPAYAISDEEWFKYKAYVHVNHFIITGKILTEGVNLPAEGAFITFLDYDQRDINTLHANKRGLYKGRVYNNTAYLKLCSADGQCQISATNYIFENGPLDTGRPLKNKVLKVPSRKYM